MSYRFLLTNLHLFPLRRQPRQALLVLQNLRTAMPILICNTVLEETEWNGVSKSTAPFEKHLLYKKSCKERIVCLRCRLQSTATPILICNTILEETEWNGVSKSVFWMSDGDVRRWRNSCVRSELLLSVEMSLWQRRIPPFNSFVVTVREETEGSEGWPVSSRSDGNVRRWRNSCVGSGLLLCRCRLAKNNEGIQCICGYHS